MTYPLSSPVTAGQPTAADHYNNLRKDALNLGQADADVVNLGNFFKRFYQGVSLQYLATNRVRVPYSASNPPTLMINGFMLQAVANVDLPSGLISGAAATWYIFANRTAGSTTFTLSANTSASEGTDQRLIGQAYWDGSSLGLIVCYLSNNSIPTADYDSGWFAATYNMTYTRPHGLANTPRLVTLYHSSDSAGVSEWVLVTVIQHGELVISPLGFDATNIYVQTGGFSGYGATCYSMRRSSNAGYYRLFAWL